MTVFHCPFCGSGQVIARSDRTIECGFCSQAFTVQVQPMFPGFPQTDPETGQPVPVPGMPGQISPTPAPLNAIDPNQIGEDGAVMPAEDAADAGGGEMDVDGGGDAAEGDMPDVTSTRHGQRIDLRDFTARS